MRELHVVAVSEDGRHVVLAASKGAAKGTYRVRLDARLISAVKGDLGVHDADLSPKEIQARLRAGESVEKIAKSAGITREALYRALRPDSAPRFDTVSRVCAALGVRLVAQPIHG